MHILIASPYLPWPLFEGGRVAQYRTFEALQDACTFTLVVPIHNLEEEANVKLFNGKFQNVNVVAVRCFYVPPPPSARARLRRAAGNFLRRIIPGPKILTPVQPQHSNEAVPSYQFGHLPSAFVKKVDEEFSKGCDIFQAEFADMMTLGPLMAGRVPSLFVHHQLHFVYARRFLEANGGGGVNARYVTERMIQEEAAYLKTFDSVIVFSGVDQTALKTFCPSLEVNVSPFPSPEEPLPVEIPFDETTGHFVFVASESHRPNADGLSWFMQHVWPEIKRRLPDARIEVIGKWSDAGKASLPNHVEIHFAGFVPELAKALQKKIMIVPLWVGSGVRTKILAAWSASCPVVTTTVGVEGLPGKAGEHFIVADEAPAFAAACIELSQNVKQLNRIAVNGRELVQKYYSLAAVRRTRLEIYEKLLTARKNRT